QERLLAADVVVERGLLQPHRVGDVLHRGGVVALLAEQLACRVEDLLLAAGHAVASLQGGRSPRPYRPFGRAARIKNFQAHRPPTARRRRLAISPRTAPTPPPRRHGPQGPYPGRFGPRPRAGTAA